jgi:predicted Zn-dependent peptidase
VIARARVVAVALSFALVPLFLPAIGVAASGALPHGGTYVVQPDPTIATSAIGLWFRAPSAGYNNAAPGMARVAATAAAAATLESGSSLVSFVRSLGGRLSINVYSDIVGVTVIAPASAARRIVAAMSAAYFTPTIDDDALKTAQRDAAVLSAQRQYSSDDLLNDALFAQVFSDGPAHQASLPDSVAQLGAMTKDDVVAYARRAFRSANATIALAGNVDESMLGAVTAGTPGTPDAPFDSSLASPATDASLPAKSAGLGLAWSGPPIHDERAATAMDFVSDYLFRDETGLVAKAYDANPDTYVSGQFVTLHSPGVMVVTIGGEGLDAAQTAVTAAMKKLEVPLDAATFAAAREAFLFHLASDAQTPMEQSENLGWYSVEGNLGYAPSNAQGEYWKIAQSLDADYVASIVKRYLDHPVVVRLTSAPAKDRSS